MTTYECSACGGTDVERSYTVSSLYVTCPREECGEFAAHVNLDHPRVRRLLEELGLEPSAPSLADAVDARF